MLQFRTEVGGLDVSGIDMITWDDDGQIVDFTVMVRPAKALQAVIEHMGAELLRMLEAAGSSLTLRPWDVGATCTSATSIDRGKCRARHPMVNRRRGQTQKPRPPP